MKHQEKIEDKLKDAEKFLKNTNHLINVTYPLVEDGKLLLGVVENLFLASTCSIESLLILERSKKNIPPFHDSFESKYRVFNENILQKYRFDEKELETIREIKDILMKHKESSIEFSRKEKFVIWDDDYDATTLKYDKVKHFYNIVNTFYNKVKALVKNND